MPPQDIGVAPLLQALPTTLSCTDYNATLRAKDTPARHDFKI
jgi:hypothetical protein